MSRLAETLRDSKRKDPKKIRKIHANSYQKEIYRGCSHDSDDSPLIFLKIKNMPKASKARPPGQNQVQKLLKSSPEAPSGTVRRHKRATTFSRQHKNTDGVWFTLVVGSRPLGQCPVQRWTEPATVKVFKQTTNVLFQNKHLKITEFFEIPTLAKSARFMVVALDFQQIQTYLFWNSQVQLRSKLHVHLIGRIHERPGDVWEKYNGNISITAESNPKGSKRAKKTLQKKKNIQ